MSPEQAAGRIDQIGPASDIYSLGATLYNLLTGKVAFDGMDVFSPGQGPRGRFPATSLGQPDDRPRAGVGLPQGDGTGARGPLRVLPALADDVERWAADEPVSSWREPLGRRARRWARRNRTAVAAATVAVVAAVIGLSAVLVVQTRAKGDLARSLDRETAANTELVRSRAAVQARYDLAVEAVKTFHTGVSEDFLLKEDKFKELRDRLLMSASAFYGRLGLSWVSRLIRHRDGHCSRPTSKWPS